VAVDAARPGSINAFIYLPPQKTTGLTLGSHFKNDVQNLFEFAEG
jgi:hypothetical protein